MGFISSIKNAFTALKAEKEQKKSYANTETVGGLRIPEGGGLFIGTSTGELLKRNHADGMAGGQDVWLRVADDSIFLNTLVLGGTGAGKTSAVMRPFVHQIARRNDWGMFCLDVKADFYLDVQEACNRYNRRFVKIGVGDDCLGINLLSGLTPAMASSFLENTFYLTGGGGGDSFWIQSAVAVIENSLGVLYYLGSEYYNLHTLYQYIFIDEVRSMINDEVEKVRSTETDKTSLRYRNLQANLSYFNNVFLVQDTKLQSSIKASISTIISGFCNPIFIDKFSSTNEADNYDMTGLLNGDICVLALPIAEYGNTAKVIYTILKLKYFNLLQQRQYNKQLPQLPTCFMCDEYQTVISASPNGLSDLDFWSKNRSSKCFGIISTQSITAFEAQLNGNKSLTNTILSNFRQKICFRTEDPATIDYMKSIVGRTLVQRRSSSYSNGDSGQFFGFTNKTYSNNYSTSLSVAEQEIIDANLIRHLQANEVIALLNLNREAYDDVVIVYPMY